MIAKNQIVSGIFVINNDCSNQTIVCIRINDASNVLATSVSMTENREYRLKCVSLHWQSLLIEFLHKNSEVFWTLSFWDDTKGVFFRFFEKIPAYQVVISIYYWQIQMIQLFVCKPYFGGKNVQTSFTTNHICYCKSPN